MLLKISDGASGWTIFDQVDNVHYCQIGCSVKDVEELESIDVQEDSVRLILISKECFPLENDHRLDVGLLGFERDNRKYSALYTDVAYICDNSGSTVERVKVPNSKRRN